MLGTELQSHARSAKALNSRTTFPALLSFKKDFSLHLFFGVLEIDSLSCLDQTKYTRWPASVLQASTSLHRHST